MVNTTTFVRKPLYVSAVQVTEENFEDVAKWCQGEIHKDGDGSYIRVRVHKPLNPRQTQAHVEDWILYTDRGYKVYTTKAFRANFDPVESESDPNQLSTEELRRVRV